MEVYLTPDIITNILNHLGKDDSFNLLNTSKNTKPLKRILYGKYLFNHDLISNKIVNDIKHIECHNMNDLTAYKNIISLTIKNINIEWLPDLLPKNLKSLSIISSSFCQSLSGLPDTLQSLTLHCQWFDRSFDNLPKSLVSLELKLCSYSYSLDKLPIGLKSLKLLSYPCWAPYKLHLNDLPDGLQMLYIGTYYTKNIIHKLPNSLQSLYLGNCMDYGQFINNLPHGMRFLNIPNELQDETNKRLLDKSKNLVINCRSNDYIMIL